MHNKSIYCLPGFACTQAMYCPLKNILSLKGINLCGENHFGMGEQKAVNESYSIDDLATFHWNKIGNEKVNLLGSSMGGFVAIVMALQKPELVNSLILICTLGPKENGFLLPNAITEEGLKMFDQMPIDIQAKLGTDATVYPDLKERKPEIYQSIVDYRKNNKADISQAIRQNNAAIQFLNSKINFESIQNIPTLIITGKNDRFVNPKNSVLLKSKFIHSKLEVVSDTDHFVFMEDVESVGNSIFNAQDFLKI